MISGRGLEASAFRFSFWLCCCDLGHLILCLHDSVFPSVKWAQYCWPTWGHWAWLKAYWSQLMGFGSGSTVRLNSLMLIKHFEILQWKQSQLCKIVMKCTAQIQISSSPTVRIKQMRNYLPIKSDDLPWLDRFFCKSVPCHVICIGASIVLGAVLTWNKNTVPAPIAHNLSIRQDSV